MRKVTAIALSTDGTTVCTVENSTKKTFVQGLIPGEEAVLSDSQEVIKINKSSEHRVAPPCPYFSECGGCDFQFIKIEEQRQQKLKYIIHTLENYFKVQFEEYLNASEDLPSYNYRSKVTFKRQNGRTGYFMPKSHKLVEIKECALLKNRLNQHLHKNDYYKNLKDDVTGIRLELIDGQIFESYQINNKFFQEQSDYPVNSFAQVNEAGNQELHRLLLEQNWGDNLTEFYAGSGNFTFAIAAKNKHLKITAIEKDRKLVDLANQQQNSQVNFIKSSTEKFIQSNNFAGSVLLDPPRAGAAELCNALQPDRQPFIAYVSCNVKTLGRDLQQLKQKGYSMERLYFIDMFAQTKHVECLAILKS